MDGPDHRVALDEDAILTLAASQTGDVDLLLEAAQSQLDGADLDAFCRWVAAAEPIIDRWAAGNCSEPLPPFERFGGQS